MLDAYSLTVMLERGHYYASLSLDNKRQYFTLTLNMLKRERHLIVIFYCSDFIILRTEFYRKNLHKKSDLALGQNFNSPGHSLDLCVSRWRRA